MGRIERVSCKEIESALSHERRQYLVGSLTLPQEVDAIMDENVEVGITRYKEYTVEKPHYHTDCSEYQYVLTGKAKYLDVVTDEVTEVTQGDFFVIRPYTIYYQKSLPNTTILFAKVPGGNDKHLVSENQLSARQIEWSECYEY